jgi:hypothetical protein
MCGIGRGKTLFWEECKWMEELTTKHFESNIKSKRMKPLWWKMMLVQSTWVIQTILFLFSILFLNIIHVFLFTSLNRILICINHSHVHNTKNDTFKKRRNYIIKCFLGIEIVYLNVLKLSHHWNSQKNHMIWKNNHFYIDVVFDNKMWLKINLE